MNNLNKNINGIFAFPEEHFVILRNEESAFYSRQRRKPDSSFLLRK